MPETIQPSSVRQFACSTASGASASTAICCGACRTDAADWPTIACIAGDG